MAPKKVRLIVDWISSTINIGAPPSSIYSLTALGAVEVHGLDHDQAAEFADRHADAVLVELQTALALAEEDVSFTRFAFNTADESHVQGSSFVQPNEENTPVAEAKRKRLDFSSYADFLRKLTWREFEGCCKGILGLLGCADPTLTAGSNDQGVDFFGQLTLEGRLDNFSELPGIDRRLGVWMVGQAKHYTETRVSTPDLRELVGSVELARAGAFADGGIALKGFHPRVCDPVFYLFFTTGTISSDGRILLKESGVVSMDGSQIAVFLSDNGIGLVDGAFDRATALAWVTSNVE